MTRYITVTLTVPQANRILDSLQAHFAGDTSEGDLVWTAKENQSARAAKALIEAALAGPEPANAFDPRPRKKSAGMNHAEAFARGRQIVKGEAMTPTTPDLITWLDELKAASAVLDRARQTWPGAVLRTARKVSICDNAPCGQPIQQHERFIDPGENHPYRAGGFGGLRYCLRCGGGEPHV